MKCISLWQPWAALIAIGAKRIETRSWKPPMLKGCSLPLAIHCAKKWDRQIESFCFEPPVLWALRRNESEPERQMIDRLKAARGCIVAVCEVFGWGSTELAVPSEHERVFGDYSPGRFAWYLNKVQVLPQPVQWTGRQGLFSVPDALIAEGFK